MAPVQAPYTGSDIFGSLHDDISDLDRPVGKIRVLNRAAVQDLFFQLYTVHGQLV